MLTEVVTFLEYVTVFRDDLIGDLNTLNTALRSPSMGAGVAGFIPLAETAVRDGLEIRDSNDYQCALTPEALTLYLQEMCGYTGATLTRGVDPGGRGMLGLMNAAGYRFIGFTEMLADMFTTGVPLFHRTNGILTRMG